MNEKSRWALSPSFSESAQLMPNAPKPRGIGFTPRRPSPADQQTGLFKPVAPVEAKKDAAAGRLRSSFQECAHGGLRHTL